MAKTSMNLEENVEGALCYILFFVTGIIFYVDVPEATNIN